MVLWGLLGGLGVLKPAVSKLLQVPEAAAGGPLLGSVTRMRYFILVLG